jgi:hypothetical protein
MSSVGSEHLSRPTSKRSGELFGRGALVDDPELVEVLKGSAWYPGRTIRTDEVEAAWAERGITASEVVRDFVAEFNGVEFRYARHPLAGGTDLCVLDAIKATRSVHREWLAAYEVRAQEPLWPIGIAASGHVVLMMSPTGRVIGGYDDFLAVYGENGRQALRNIAHRREPVHLPGAR